MNNLHVEMDAMTDGTWWLTTLRKAECISCGRNDGKGVVDQEGLAGYSPNALSVLEHA